MIRFKEKYFALVMFFAGISLLFLYSCAHTARQAERSFSHAGLERKYILYAPSFKAEQTGARPLLFVLHGGGGTNHGMVRLTNGRFNELADRPIPD